MEDESQLYKLLKILRIEEGMVLTLQINGAKKSFELVEGAIDYVEKNTIQVREIVKIVIEDKEFLVVASG